jgi:CubicO group peptidase (beta-lactamase class C family)
MHVIVGDERDSVERTVPAAPIRMAYVFAAGAICSTASDLLLWRRGLASGRVISRAASAFMNDSANTRGIGRAYGFAVFLGQLAGCPWIAHEGSIDGFRSRVASYPRDGLTVAVLANTGATTITALERAVMRTSLGLRDPAPLMLPVSSVEPAVTAFMDVAAA